MKKYSNELHVKPTKGSLIVAQYVRGGKVVENMELGVVVNYDAKGFVSQGEDGQEYNRKYTFGAAHGIRLLGFRRPKK